MSSAPAPRPHNVAFVTRAPPDDWEDETRRILQARLALVLTVLSGVSVFFAVSHFAGEYVSGVRATAPTLVPTLTFVVGVVNGALALRYRRGGRAVTELRWVEAGATAFTCWMSAALLTQVRPYAEASVSLQLALVYVLMARAVLLPSSGRRTLWICIAVLVPAGALGTWLRVRGLASHAGAEVWLSQGWVMYRGLGITTFLATLTSNVIYGLRRQVHESAHVGQYILREKLGEGGMGIVYRATHSLLRRDTAVKLLLPSRVSERAVARFEREVVLTAQLTHPNTVAIFDYGRTPDGRFYYAMEYLDGGDLQQLVDYAGPLEPERVIWILEQACRALAEAHARGLVHRDVKPSNVLLCERGGESDVAKILDFGLVKSERGPESSRSEALTGTPLYISPEGITAPDTVMARSDLYSLGAVAYCLLVGQPPFTGKTILEVCAAHLHDAPLRPSQLRAAVPLDLEAVIMRCLEKSPDARPADALALRDALLACACAHDWNAARASAWWAEHRASFRRHYTLRPTS